MCELFEELVMEAGKPGVRCSLGTCCSYVINGMVITGEDEETDTVEN